MHDITLFIHLYYPGSWELIKKKCGHLIGGSAQLIITACHDDVIREAGSSENSHTTVLKVPNIGKDIGGKLAAFAWYLHFCKRTRYIALLHDKISPQTINADYWFDQLYSIFEQEPFEKAIRILDKDAGTGIVGSKTFLKNEFIRSKKEFDTTNNDLLQGLIRDYGLKCRNYDFIAGTIFIGRGLIFEDFFSAHSPLAARSTLEPGNVLDLQKGSFTHSWERLFCFIAEDRGFKITGI